VPTFFQDHLKLMEINCPSCDEAVLITEEDKATTIKCPFCQQRFALEQPEPPLIEKPPAMVEREDKTAQSQEGEKTYFQGSTVLVSDKRVVLGGRTYVLKQITSVGRAIDYLGPKLIFGKSAWSIVIWSWVLTPVPILISAIVPILISAIAPEHLIYLSPLSILVCVVFTIWAVAMSGKPRHWVEIGSASGKEKALLCSTQEEAQKISDAINQAIIDN
jgi:hypothetical protein